MTDGVHMAATGKRLDVRLTGKLTKEFYERLVPLVDDLVRQHGKIRVLVEMHDFHGWTAGAIWQDLKFDLKHWNHIERLAIVGETRWEQGMAAFCKPFTSATIQYFDVSKLDEARTWIAEGE